MEEIEPSTSSDSSAMTTQFMDEFFSASELDCSQPSHHLLFTESFDPSPEGEEISDILIPDDTDDALNEALEDIDHFLKTIQASTTVTKSIQSDEEQISNGLTEPQPKMIKSSPKKIKSKLKKGHRYTPNFKRKVLNYAVKHTFKETAKKFGINCNTLTDWAREYKRLLILKKSTITRPGSALKTDEPSNLVTTNETELLNQQATGKEMASDVAFLQWLRKKRMMGCDIGREEIIAAAIGCVRSASTTSSWFATWVQRNTGPFECNGLLNSASFKIEKHIVYPLRFKEEVALLAQNNSKLAVAKMFGVSSRRLYEWCERFDSSSNDVRQPAPLPHQIVDQQLLAWFRLCSTNGPQPKSIEIIKKARELYAANGLSHVKCSHGWLNKMQKRLDIKLSHPDDDDLLLWVLAQLDNNISLSLTQVTAKARELAIARKIQNFKGSKGWTLRFLKRHSYLLQCSAVARLSDLPAAAAEKARSFALSLRQRIGAAGLTPGSFGCMDEVPITLVYPTDKVHTPPLLRKAGLTLAHAVVLLGATSDGRLLPPAVVFKGTHPLQTFSAGKLSIPVIYRSDGGVDANTLRLWSKHIWFRNVAAPSVLVVDSFEPHMDEGLMDDLSSGCCHIATIPPGCAMHLQPCAYNLSRRFQDIVQEEWLKHLPLTTCHTWGNKTPRPDERAVLDWIVEAYNTLREDMYSIRSSFHLTGLADPDSTLVQSKD